MGLGMGKMKTSYFMYSQIPHAGKGWTLAVCAVSRKDANQYMKAVHHGGKFVYAVTDGGNIRADCGATTAAAQEVIKANLEKMWKDIVSTLRAVGYDYVLSIEHEDMLASIDEGLSKAISLLKGTMFKEQLSEMWWA